MRTPRKDRRHQAACVHAHVFVCMSCMQVCKCLPACLPACLSVYVSYPSTLWGQEFKLWSSGGLPLPTEPFLISDSDEHGGRCLFSKTVVRCFAYGCLACMCVCTVVSANAQGQKRTADSLELQLQTLSCEQPWGAGKGTQALWRKRQCCSC